MNCQSWSSHQIVTKRDISHLIVLPNRGDRDQDLGQDKYHVMLRCAVISHDLSRSVTLFRVPLLTTWHEWLTSRYELIRLDANKYRKSRFFTNVHDLLELSRSYVYQTRLNAPHSAIYTCRKQHFYCQLAFASNFGALERCHPRVPDVKRERAVVLTLCSFGRQMDLPASIGCLGCWRTGQYVVSSPLWAMVAPITA